MLRDELQQSGREQNCLVIQIIQRSPFEIFFCKGVFFKRQRSIMSTLAHEVVILGDLPIQSSFWRNMPGFVLQIITALVVLLMLYSLYLCYSIRYLNIALAVLQQNTLKVD